jgi:nicotinamide-nucleotide amidase
MDILSLRVEKGKGAVISRMNAEIVAIGSELLLGQIIDTNSAYIAQQLAENGIEVIHTTTVGDDLGRIESVIRSAIDRSQIVITTGGIGPTEDDLTREALSNVTQHPLVFQPHLMEQIETLIRKRGFRITENNRKQAFIPEGSIPIENPKGTAPGFIVEGPNWVTLTIPGVPSEMQYLMKTTVIPFLRKRFHIENQIIRYKVLRACGLGESAIGLQIGDLMRESKNPTVGTLASIGDIKIRITAKAENPGEATSLIEKMEQEIRKRLGILIYGVGDETLQGNIARELEGRGFTLSVAEPFTGGIISQRLSGTGTFSFLQGIALPSDSSQMQFLNLSGADLNNNRSNPAKFTEVLARKIRNVSGTTLGLAVSGRVIEEQEREELRVETFCSIASASDVENLAHTLGGELQMVRERASLIALDMLRKYLLKKRKS